MKKKIIFFLYTLSGGGAERTVINIINNLDKERFDITLVLGTNDNNDYIDFLPDDIDVKALDSKKLRYSLIKLIKVINSVKPDLIFSTLNPNNLIVLLAKCLTFKKIPVVVREANNRTQAGSATFANKMITFFFYNFFANKVIALSEGVKKDLLNNFSIKENKIAVIYNPIEIQLIKKLENEIIEDVLFKDEEQIIVSVGRLVKQKDYPTLLKAIKIVTDKINIRLLILGKGPLENELKNMCKVLKIENNVEFIGFKKNPYKYLKKSDLFILSSKWEGFGHVIVEAMVTGTPVISTNCNSGPSEILENNKYGILVPVEDHIALSEKILEMLKDKKMKEKYTEMGFLRSQDFNAKSIVKQYENVFDSLL